MRWFVLIALGLAAMAAKKWALPERGKPYAFYFKDAEKKNNLPENILARMAQQESNFLTDIIEGKIKSSAGAVGIMQIIPKWHPEVNPLNAVDSIYYAGKYLAQMNQRFKSWPLALAAYNWGPANVEKYLQGQAQMPTETKNYINQIGRDVL